MARLRGKRVNYDASLFLSGTARATANIKRNVERDFTQAGDRLVARVSAAWPVDTGKQKTGVKGTPRHTKAGRFIYEIRVPFPAGFYEFGTQRQPPRPILRPEMTRTRNELRG